MKKLSLLLAVLLLAVMVVTGCSSKSSTSMDKGTAESGMNYGKGVVSNSVAPGAPAPATEPQEEEKPQDAADLADATGGFSESSADTASQEEAFGTEMGAKIIKNGYMSVETLDFDEATSTIVRRAQQQGGFIASSNVQGWSQDQARNKPMRTAHYKIRVPSSKFEQFMTDLGELGNVTRSENWGEDVSAQYFDTEARLKSLETQEDRLLAILSKAERLSDILELERELSSVRYQIENLTGTLRKWDNLVAFSTLEMDVYEVKKIEEVEEEPETLWDKIASGFKRSLENVAGFLEGLLILLVSSIPVLLLLGIIGWIVYWIVKLILRKSDQKIQRLQALQKTQTAQQEQKGQNDQNGQQK
jgi:hypothetical protein